MKIRLKDIAEMANVSIATVSNVLNNYEKARVSQEKKDEIVALAKKYNYRPNLAARSLVKSDNSIVGLIIPDLENPYFSGLTKMIERYLREDNKIVMVVNSNEDFENDIFLLDFLYQRGVSAILYAPSNNSLGNEEIIKNEVDKLPIPVIILDRMIKGIRAPGVFFDNELGSYLATRHLLDKGKRVGLLSASKYSINGLQREKGYEKAMIEADKLESMVIEYTNFSFESGYLAAPKILESNVNAIVSANDMVAYGFMKYCRDNTIDSRHFEIIGYDNLEINEYLDLAFSSVDQDIKGMAKHAVRLLDKCLNSRECDDLVFLEPNLVLR